MSTSPPVDEVPRAATPREQMLLDFLRDYDANCPVCGYNVRGLNRPLCPECRQELVLTVGEARLRLGWLLIALAPGFFSGIAACFVMIPTVGVFFEDGVVVWPLAGMVLFGWSSGILAIILAVKRNRFIAQSRTRQRWLALVIWLIHFMALVLVFAVVAPLI